MCLSESGAAEGVDGVGVGGRHVVHEAKSVTYFVGNNVNESLVEFVLWKFFSADGFIDLGGLDESPL